ncbi:MAG: hypothetical protein KF810_17360 [Rhizobiaceae bacterium]|nr:hypothetical protein [Rhizobiaceae bacterium]
MSARRIADLTEDEFEDLVRTSLRKELFSTVGLRLDDQEDQDEAREDFRLLRKIRRCLDGASSKIGGAIIMALVSGLLWLIYLGVHAFVGKTPS